MFHTKLCDLLGIKYPIIQGALGKHHDDFGEYHPAQLTAAVSNAGGLGVLAPAFLTDKQLKEEIAQTRALTDKPFALNILAASLPPVRRLVRICIEEGITIVTTGRGDPREPHVTLLKEHGVTVLSVVPTVRHALRMEAEGADVIVASGRDGGGHVGLIGSLALIPQVVNAVKIPVVAAGGIADARGFVAALALGACGVQMGTRFVASKESMYTAEQIQPILEASEENTFTTRMLSGREVRVIKIPEVEEWNEAERKGASRPELQALYSRIRKERRAMRQVGALPAGQISGMIKTIESAGDIIKNIIEEATVICKNLSLLPEAE